MTEKLKMLAEDGARVHEPGMPEYEICKGLLDTLEGIERLRIAGLTLIGLAGHDDQCDVFDLDDNGRYKTCSCGLDEAMGVIREAGKTA